MKKEKDKIKQTFSSINQSKKRKDSSPKKQLNASFSKEFINIISVETNTDDEEKNLVLAKSHYGLGDFMKMQEQILGEGNEVSSTVLDEKIKRNISSKGIVVRKIKTFVNHNDIDVNDIEENNIEENNNFLKIREIQEVSKEEFDKMKYNLLDDKYLGELENFILDFKYPVNSSNSTISIGALFPLERLIECSFNNDFDLIDEMIEKNNLYEEYIFNYRTIKGDGNCYYRAAMFRYFEIIILNKEISLLRNIIIDMKKSFNSEEIMSRREIKMNTVFKAELPLKIMIIILDLIQKDNIELAHLIFLKSLLICPIFDFGLIFYFRYIIYIYIKDNEDKLYLPNFPIKIGNLLPSKYETEEGEFLFNSFYQNYLLKMFMDAEKIIVYLTPFVLGINLDIIIFDDESEIIKKINYDGKPKYSFEEKIFLMNRKNHYELIYTKKDNDKYEEIFEKYINNDFLKSSLILLQSSKKNNIYINRNSNKNSITNKNKINISNNNYFNDVNEDNNKKNSQLNNSKVIKKKNKIKKKLKKPTFEEKELIHDNNSKTNRNQNNNNKNEKKSILTADATNISSLNSEEINYGNKINIKSRKYYIKTEKDDEIDDEEATKEASLISPEKIRILNDENKNSIHKNDEENYIKKKIYKNISKKTTKNSRSFKKKKILSNEPTKIINNTINAENSCNKILDNLSHNLDSNNNTINIDMEKIKLKKKKIILKQLDNNNNTDINNSCTSPKKKKHKLSSAVKRIVAENNISKNSEIKNNTENINTNLNNNQNNTHKKLSASGSTEKKKIIIVNYVCVKCSKKFQVRNKTEKVNLCKLCEEKEIIEMFSEKYLLYIRDCLEKKYNNEKILYNFNELLQKEINVDKKNITIENSINQLNKYNISKRESFQELLQNIFKEIQDNICVLCCHKIEIDKNSEKPIKIPCGCHFCSYKHFEEFFKNNKPIIKQEEFLCYCRHKYDTKEIYDLGIMFVNISNKVLKKSVIEYLNNKLKNECCVCENNDILVDRIRYKDKEEKEGNEKNEEVLTTYKELKHFFCKICNEKIKPFSLFLCKICDKNHILYPKTKK